MFRTDLFQIVGSHTVEIHKHIVQKCNIHQYKFVFALKSVEEARAKINEQHHHMPPNLPLSHRLLPLVRKPFICRACRQRQAIHTSNHPSAIRQYARTRGRRTQLPTRAVSTTPSVTAVNAKREIPPAYRKLHASLKALEQDAGVYVDTSQLRLALRGVESENSVTRVAGEWAHCVLELFDWAGVLTRGKSWDSMAKPEREGLRGRCWLIH